MIVVDTFMNPFSHISFWFCEPLHSATLTTSVGEVELVERRVCSYYRSLSYIVLYEYAQLPQR